MTLRGQIADFPIETVVQLLASTGKTGQLEVRGDGQSGSLGFDGGRLVSAAAGDDSGEPALGAVFTLSGGDFEFIPWGDAPVANLSGDLDQLLDRAVVERNKIIAIREVVPSDDLRFRLSERAAEGGEVTLAADQWRTLLAVNGERNVRGIADHLKVGRLTALSALAGLVSAGFIDTVRPPAAAPAAPAAPPAEQAEPAGSTSRVEPSPDQPELPQPATAASERPAPATDPNAWERPAPATDPNAWERPARPEPDRRSDLAAALDARMSGLSAGTAAPAQPGLPEQPEQPEQPLTGTSLDAEPDRAPERDARLAALSGVFEAPPDERIDQWRRSGPPGAPAPAPGDLEEWATPSAEPQPEEKKKGLFGFLKRDEPAPEPAPSTAVADRSASSRAGGLAAFANALLTEYNSGQYGKGQVDDRIANLLMRVDEQADPIDRPLPIVDDRIDVAALERENVPEPQAVPYLALLVSQVYEDAERAFGRDKAKRGYRAAQQHVFGNDASALAAPDIAGRLPKL